MKKCWDSNPSNRPTITELEHEISEWIRCINEFYRYNRDENYRVAVPSVDDILKNDMIEFIEANNTLAQEQANIPTIVHSHSQAYHTSRNITEIIISECLEHIIDI
ncbi:kinase-like domain-containing protein [Rhizophagus clarus]|uniref:Kinase-like domain-containing protein n=2 Tax=Rhizophagus clarus TaxID=94130 RepID=A0A8H3LD62_9GLOM|nr:kinase-like domain-containing protein [Rhizophagus clarus]